MRINAALGVVLVLAVLAACAPASKATALDATTQDELLELYRSHDFFGLDERLAEFDASAGAPVHLFYTAVVQHAFNELDASSRTLESLLDGDRLDTELRRIGLRVARDNYIRLHRYADAVRMAESVLNDDPEDAEDARNTRRLLQAITDVPPQQATVGGPSRIALETDAAEGTRIPLTVNGHQRNYLFDTGANFSVLMRTEAESLGLVIRPAGIAVGNSAGGEVPADLAVADRVSIGNVEFRHVVFLVFPDELLSFPQAGFEIRGIVGFPVMEAMGEVRFFEDRIEIPAELPDRPKRNLAFEQLEPLVRVGYGEDRLLCRFDTGANVTDFYEPFFRRYRETIEAQGTKQTVTTAGVGQERFVEAYTLDTIELRVGDSPVHLEKIDVYTTALGDADDNYLDCNLGQDVLRAFDEYAINFRSMSFVLSGSRQE